ncbi:MAG: adenine phosphoribosyltransferase [Leptospiraceae bacterium]|nr:adenine phosphoribosyltransferase [Leptospiraceae bacterium]MCB1201086.1 adenine phosphoribosyltransferase [Leptospiraceae bacterium]
MEHAIRKLIRNVPDFPKPGIQFKDITPVLQDPEALKKVIEWFSLTLDSVGQVDLIAGIESRGFIIGSALAVHRNLGFIPIRKPGKLPYQKTRITYELEYGSDALEMHTDAVSTGQRVAIIDDLLATGGTAEAACKLIEMAGAEVAALSVLIELDDLKGREKIKSSLHKNIFSLIHY